MAETRRAYAVPVARELRKAARRIERASGLEAELVPRPVLERWLRLSPVRRAEVLLAMRDEVERVAPTDNGRPYVATQEERARVVARLVSEAVIAEGGRP